MTRPAPVAVGIDTLECSGCHRMLPDNAFHKDKLTTKRRYRKYQCTECVRLVSQDERAALVESGELTICPACDQPWRRSGEYVCSHCANQAPMFNNVRPPEMQGRAVPIFAPWAKERS